MKNLLILAALVATLSACSTTPPVPVEPEMTEYVAPVQEKYELVVAEPAMVVETPVVVEEETFKIVKTHTKHLKHYKHKKHHKHHAKKTVTTTTTEVTTEVKPEQ